VICHRPAFVPQPRVVVSVLAEHLNFF
jgi:hypothetical protein